MLNIVLSQCQHVGIIALNKSYIINPPLGGSHMFHSILILFHAHTYSDTVSQVNSPQTELHSFSGYYRNPKNCKNHHQVHKQVQICWPHWDHVSNIVPLCYRFQLVRWISETLATPLLQVRHKCTYVTWFMAVTALLFLGLLVSDYLHYTYYHLY